VWRAWCSFNAMLLEHRTPHTSHSYSFTPINWTTVLSSLGKQQTRYELHSKLYTSITTFVLISVANADDTISQHQQNSVILHTISCTTELAPSSRTWHAKQNRQNSPNSCSTRRLSHQNFSFTGLPHATFRRLIYSCQISVLVCHASFS